MTILFVIIALLVLSVLILVHEFGHFIVAKKSGVWVEEFGMGLPPRVFGKKIGETLYSINALPFGGFVRLHGETSGEGLKKLDRAFFNKSKKIRITVALAGIFMNFVLAIVAFTVINFYTGVPRESGEVRVVAVDEGSPASDLMLTEEDVVVSVNSLPISTSREFIVEVDKFLGEEITLSVKTGDGMRDVSITPRAEPPENEGPLGVVISSSEPYFPPLVQRPFIYTKEAIVKTWDVSNAIVVGFVSIFAEIGNGNVPAGVAGPIGITALLAEVAKLGILPLLEFGAFISINLALLNLIPFPPLDGSRVVLTLVEFIVGSKKRPKIEEYLNMGGMALMILLFVFLTAREIPSLISAGSLSGFVDSILQ